MCSPHQGFNNCFKKSGRKNMPLKFNTPGFNPMLGAHLGLIVQGNLFKFKAYLHFVVVMI